jgi:hypothetical protein
MKRLLLGMMLCVTFISAINKVQSQTVHPYDANIQGIVDVVNVDTIMNNILTLQGLERYSPNAAAIESSDYLTNYFNRFGFDTIYTQDVSGSAVPNIIAVKYGEVFPDSVIIMGAHYDSYALGAPAADDNGSGTAAVMEAARTITNNDYKRTIKLIFFAAEEQGDVGSGVYATNAYNTGEIIIGAFCPDAIGYVYPGDPVNCDVYLDSASVPLRNAFAAYTTMYIPGFPVANVQWPLSASSDCYKFWEKGYKSIMPSEGQYSVIPFWDHMSPDMHTSNDLVGTCDSTQTLKITQSMIAAITAMAEINSSISVEETNAANNFNINIYPNPASTLVSIDYYLPFVSNIEILFTDISGRIIIKVNNSAEDAGMHHLEISTLDLQRGFYLLKISNGNCCYTSRICINR